MAPTKTLLTSRAGGISLPPFDSLNLGFHVGDDAEAVLENRRRVCETFGGTLDDLVLANQVHGANVAMVDARDRGRGARDLESAIAATDALVTKTSGLVLCILVADCLPVAFLDDAGSRLGVAHAGWRGIATGVLEATAAALFELGSTPPSLRIEVGPGIGIDRFEVGEEVIDQLGLSQNSPHVDRSREKPHVDLTGVVVDRLLALGLTEHQLKVTPERTGDQYFSARASERSGRFAMLAKILDNGA
jgi:YfiH family protein